MRRIRAGRGRQSRQNSTSTMSIPTPNALMVPQVPELGPHDDAPPTYEWALEHSPTPEQSARRSSFNFPVIALVQVTEVRVRSSIQDCRFDTGAPYMYVRTGHAHEPILKYGLDGKLVRSFGSSNKTEGSVCADTKRDLLLSTSGDTVYRTTRLGVPPGLFYHAYIRVPAARNINHVTYITPRDLYAVADIDLHAVFLVKATTGDVKKMIGGKGSGDLEFNKPHSIAFNPDSPDDVIAVTDYYNHCVKLFSLKGKLKEVLGCHGYGEGKLITPSGVCIDNKGRVLICDTGNRRVVRVTLKGRRAAQWECVISPEQLEDRYPKYIDVTSNGHVIVSVMTSLARNAKHSWILYKNYS